MKRRSFLKRLAGAVAALALPKPPVSELSATEAAAADYTPTPYTDLLQEWDVYFNNRPAYRLRMDEDGAKRLVTIYNQGARGALAAVFPVAAEQPVLVDGPAGELTFTQPCAAWSATPLTQ